MKTINISEIIKAVQDLCQQANFDLGQDIISSLKRSRSQDKRGKKVLDILLENAKIAKNKKIPICQDTGIAIVFVEIGQNVQIIGGDLTKAINKGVELGYKKGYLRKSTSFDPLDRKNLGQNLPAIIHTEIVPGNKLKISLMAKGGGAENKSQIKMFNPTASKEEIIGFIVETAKKAGPNACPPFVIGIGIGGNFEYCALLAKKSLLRKVGVHNKNKKIAAMEKEILQKINKSGIGPSGLGGKITALDVHIETYPCHIASLPVAVNVECHAHRVKLAIL